MNLKLALKDVEQSFKQLEFSIKLMCYCELGHMNKEEFDTAVVIQLDDGTVGFPEGAFETVDDLIRSAQIMVCVCFGVSAITLDSAYETAGIRPNPDSSDLRGQLRTLIYMVRCAFAHNFADPLWEVRGKFVKIVELVLEGERVSLDLRGLNGRCFDYSHIGGFSNWFKIQKLAVQHLNKYL